MTQSPSRNLYYSQAFSFLCLNSSHIPLRLRISLTEESKLGILFLGSSVCKAVWVCLEQKFTKFILQKIRRTYLLKILEVSVSSQNKFSILIKIIPQRISAVAQFIRLVPLNFRYFLFLMFSLSSS